MAASKPVLHAFKSGLNRRVEIVFLAESETLLVFTFLLLAELFFLPGLLISIISPKYRVWPPPHKRSWQFWYVWILAIIGMVGVPIIGIIDWGSLHIGGPVIAVAGITLIATGMALAVWGVRTLSSDQSMGMKGEFITRGPYRYTRNPQYLGDVLLMIGIVLVTDSVMALVTGTLAILWFLLAPLAEEPWLSEQFGEEYEQYCRRVPRFVSLRSFSRLTTDSALPEKE
ncbi:MAG: methyltransferase family protein [Candidatus Thorarchaeota archaeon]